MLVEDGIDQSEAWKDWTSNSVLVNGSQRNSQKCNMLTISLKSAGGRASPRSGSSSTVTEGWENDL